MATLRTKTHELLHEFRSPSHARTAITNIACFMRGLWIFQFSLLPIKIERPILPVFAAWSRVTIAAQTKRSVAAASAQLCFICCPYNPQPKQYANDFAHGLAILSSFVMCKIRLFCYQLGNWFATVCTAPRLSSPELACENFLAQKDEQQPNHSESQ